MPLHACVLAHTNFNVSLQTARFIPLVQVKASVFVAYLRSVGLPISIAIIILYLLNNVASIGANLWLSDWSDDVVVENTVDEAQRDMRLGVYGALGLAQGE